MAQPLTVLCIASYEKGAELIRACSQAGARVLLLTVEKLRDVSWPRESIAEVYVMPDLMDRVAVTNAVTWLTRSDPIDCIIALDEFDMEMAAALREHFRMGGMGETAVRFFRDKLAMRMGAREAGILAPAFTGLFNHAAIQRFLDDTSGPWILKPRTQASAIGMKKVHRPQEVWPLLEQLGDEQSHYLLERFVPGDVFHVDAIVADGQMVFAEVHRYGAPPFDVMHGGGVFSTATVDRDSADYHALRSSNEQIARSFGLRWGVMHTEFIRAHEDGGFYFLETAARVGGANIAETIEAATGINLWREWGRLELAAATGMPYDLPDPRRGYAGVLISLAKQQWPDLGGYTEPEIVWRLKKEHHAGLIVASDSPQRVEELLDGFTRRFFEDFQTSLPAPDKATN